MHGWLAGNSAPTDGSVVLPSRSGEGMPHDQKEKSYAIIFAFFTC